jgi:hypothetical protein
MARPRLLLQLQRVSFDNLAALGQLLQITQRRPSRRVSEPIFRRPGSALPPLGHKPQLLMRLRRQESRWASGTRTATNRDASLLCDPSRYETLLSAFSPGSSTSSRADTYECSFNRRCSFSGRPISPRGLSGSAPSPVCHRLTLPCTPTTYCSPTQPAAPGTAHPRHSRHRPARPREVDPKDWTVFARFLSGSRRVRRAAFLPPCQSGPREALGSHPCVALSSCEAP